MHNMNRLLEMEVFVRVVDAGSISGAADRMDIAKSAISRRLGELEARLGVRLLNRTTRRLSLTGAGSAFYERCTGILSDVTDAERSISTADAELQGVLRIAAPLSFGLAHVGPAINEFMRQHPGVTVDLDFNDRQIDLVEEGFDLAIRSREVVGLQPGGAATDDHSQRRLREPGLLGRIRAPRTAGRPRAAPVAALHEPSSTQLAVGGAGRQQGLGDGSRQVDGEQR